MSDRKLEADAALLECARQLSILVWGGPERKPCWHPDRPDVWAAYLRDLRWNTTSKFSRDRARAQSRWDVISTDWWRRSGDEEGDDG